MFQSLAKDIKLTETDKVCNPNRTPLPEGQNRGAKCPKLSICWRKLSMLQKTHFEINTVIL
jgi:hypothetical protein